MKLWKKIKKYSIILFIWVCMACSPKIVSEKVSSDTTTTFTHKNLDIKFKGDTISSGYDINTFLGTFKDLKTGQTITTGKKGSVAFKVIKTSNSGFELEAISTTRDTTIQVQEKVTVINHSKEVVKEKKESFIERFYDSITRWVFWVIVLLLLMWLLKNFMVI